MRITVIVALLIFLFSCVGGGRTAKENGNGLRLRQKDICARIPVGIGRFQYMDPSLKNLKISCRDVARCAALTGGTPVNVPCE